MLLDEGRLVLNILYAPQLETFPLFALVLLLLKILPPSCLFEVKMFPELLLLKPLLALRLLEFWLKMLVLILFDELLEKMLPRVSLSRL